MKRNGLGALQSQSGIEHCRVVFLGMVPSHREKNESIGSEIILGTARFLGVWNRGRSTALGMMARFGHADL
jgi:hypothetical protein